MKEVENLKYKVSVRCMTYNQRLFIEDALDGFCMQQTNFPFICTIVDDASTDGEQNVLRQYLADHFNQDDKSIAKSEETDDYKMSFAQHKDNNNCFFAVYFLKYNHYNKKDSIPYLQEWTRASQYIAYCEGDDFWIDRHKLQRQVSFLDNNPDYLLCFHNAIVRYENQNKKDHILSNFETGEFDTVLLFEKWQLPLASVLMHKDVYDSPLLDELWKVFKGGFGYFITASLEGKIYGLSECLSVYRRNDGGVSNGISPTDVLYNHYGYAKVTNNPKVMKVVDKEAYKKLSRTIPSLVVGRHEAKRMLKLVWSYNKMVVVKSLIASPFLYVNRFFTHSK